MQWTISCCQIGNANFVNTPMVAIAAVSIGRLRCGTIVACYSILRTHCLSGETNIILVLLLSYSFSSGIRPIPCLLHFFRLLVFPFFFSRVFLRLLAKNKTLNFKVRNLRTNFHFSSLSVSAICASLKASV